MLYRAYSNPMELVKRYISQGRLDTFVEGFITAEAERKKAEAEKENDWMIWIAYVHSDTDLNFGEYKKRVMGQSPEEDKQSDAELTEDGIQSILNRLFPA